MKTGRAVVLGGGFAGLVSARVLSERFREVWIVERDVYPDGPVARARVPQGTQAHILLARGLQVLEGLFPQLPEALDAMGVPESDFGLDVRQTLGDVVMPPVDSGVHMRCCPRPALEALVRRQVEALPEVKILQGARVADLDIDGQGVVTGVRVVPEAGEALDLASDLVVDCRGRGAELPKWLEEKGFGAPRTEIVNAGFTYGTAVYRPRVPVAPGDPAAYFCAPRFPDCPVAGLGIHQPDGTFMATLIMAPGLTPPTEPQAFLDTLKTLPIPDVARQVEGGTMVDPVRLYKATQNRRHFVEAMDRWPGRYVALGDVVCALNPRFGQGMTVASVEAGLLRDALSGRGRLELERRPARFCQAFQRAVGRAIAMPWAMVCAEDAAWMPDRTVGIVDRISSWYMQRLIRISCESADACVRFIRVAQMLDGPAHALHPRLLVPALVGALRPTPRALPEVARA